MAEAAVDEGIVNLKSVIEELEKENPWSVDEVGNLTLAKLNFAKHMLERLEASVNART